MTAPSPDRYSRQTLLPEIGAEGQARLRESTVAIVGAGALGSVAAELLARAGVGKLLLIDPDVVELSNLQRQALYTEADVGVPKVEAARVRLAAINSEVRVDVVRERLTAENRTLLDEAELILDGTDNLATRFLLNEYAMRQGIPFVYCAAVQTKGRVYVVDPRREGRACLHCLLGGHTSEGNSETLGILATTARLAATLQVGEALKLLLGKEYAAGLLVIDAWQPSLAEYPVKQRLDCPVCKSSRELV